MTRHFAFGLCVAFFLSLGSLTGCAEFQQAMQQDKSEDLAPPPGLAEEQQQAPPLERARAALAAGEPAKALAAAEEHLAANPHDRLGWHLKALALAAGGDNDAALEAFDRALMDASTAQAAEARQRARMLLGMGKPAEARQALEAALVQAPDDPALQHELARLILAQGGGRDLDKARRAAYLAAQADPSRAAYWETLGRIQQALGQDRDAVRSYHRWLLLEPGSAEAQAHLLSALMALSPETVARLAASPAPAKPEPAKP